MNSKNPKRLFLTIPTLRGGGAERVFTTLVRHLDPALFTVTLVVVDLRGAVHRESIPSSVRLVDLDCRHVRTALPKLIALIRHEKPDVVLSTLSHLNLSLAALKWAFPKETLLVVRETVVPSQFAATSFRQRALFALYRLVHRGFDCLICQSNDILFDVVKNFGVRDTKCVVIPNPVDTVEVGRLSRLPVDWRGIPAGAIKLVAAGRLTYQKGFDILLAAFARIAKPDVHLIILGEGEALGELNGLAEKLGISAKVSFFGYQANPYSMVAGADAFILSSRFEGMPNVVLEALCCGTPVIATPAPGGVHEILDGIEQCVIAARIDADSLASAIEKWLAGPKSRIRAEQIEPYAAAKVTRRYEAALLGLHR